MESWDSVPLCQIVVGEYWMVSLLDAETMMKLLIFLQSMKQWKLRLYVVKRLMNDMIPFI